MTATVENKVTEELLERLRQAGAIAEVVSPNLLDEYRPKDKQAIVSAIATNENPELSCQGNPPAKAWNVEFSIIAVVRQSSNDSANIENKLMDFTGDVLKGITTDTGGYSWWQFAGNAINANLQSITKEISPDGSMMTNTISILVTYRTDEDNPFNRR